MSNDSLPTQSGQPQNTPQITVRPQDDSFNPAEMVLERYNALREKNAHIHNGEYKLHDSRGATPTTSDPAPAEDHPQHANAPTKSFKDEAHAEVIEPPPPELPDILEEELKPDDILGTIEDSPDSEVEVQPPVDEPVDPEEPLQEDADVTDPAVDGDEENSPAKSIKDLRRIANSAKQEADEVKQQLTEAREKIDKYEKGELVPETLTELQDRVTELEYYEKLVNFRNSSEYQKKFSNPLKIKEKQLTDLAKDYDVAPAVLKHALSIGNRKDLNAYLNKHFDPVGALEARDTINDMRDIIGQAQEAEKEPALERQRIQQELMQQEQQQHQERLELMTTSSERGWSDAVKDLQVKSKFPELNIPQTDPNYSKVTQPLLTAAATEYGKLVKRLAKDGLTHLSPEIAKSLSTRFILSQLSAVTAASRDQHYERAEQIATNAKRESFFSRPRVGGGGTGSPAPQNNAPRTPMDTAKALREKVMGKGSV